MKEFEANNENDYLPLRDVVFNTLRTSILTGELKPGERLMEIHLADKLGVSRTPIREAIRKLELEGLVTMIPRRGAEVAQITEKNLRDVLEVRRALDALAVELACERITEDELAELKKAEHFIFMEYHAIEQAESFERILNVLKDRAAHGVEVRIFYDDVGSIGFINHDFRKRMEENDIACRVFNPIIPVLSVFMNNRDHRKITVIDGKVGFTGGYNLANEYFNITHPYGHWKDTGLRIYGEAAYSFTLMCLELWNAFNNTNDNCKKYLPHRYHPEPFPTDGYVLPYCNSPFESETLAQDVYLELLNQAKNYVYIFTPYLIIDNEMLVSLCNAAKRGVDVRIVTPGIPDKKMIFLLTQSHYEPLLKCGVKIYQYTPGFIHAKSFLCDDKIGTVGSINLDYRSLFLHFECGVFMYKTKALMQLKEDCMDTFAASEEMTLEFCRGQNVFIRIFQGMMRLFAPLL
mgnify:CR=1 FL=1